MVTLLLKRFSINVCLPNLLVAAVKTLSLKVDISIYVLSYISKTTKSELKN